MRRFVWRQAGSRVHELVDEDGNVVRTITTILPSSGDPSVGYHVMTTDGWLESAHAALGDAMNAAEKAAE
jgi:hypothetical protein